MADQGWRIGCSNSHVHRAIEEFLCVQEYVLVVQVFELFAGEELVQSGESGLSITTHEVENVEARRAGSNMRSPSNNTLKPNTSV